MSTAQIAEITHRFLEPLNDKTRRLLAPVRLMPYDKLHVGLSEDGKNFVARTKTDESQLTDSYSTRYAPRDGSYDARQFFKRIPQRRGLLDGSWVLAATDFTAIVINALWPREKIEFTDDAKVVYDFLLARFLRQTQSAKAYADFKVNGVVPEPPKDFVDHPEFPLMKFQRTAFAAQVETEGANLWMEQGTGKTPIVIARVNYEAHKTYEREKRMYRALVVVPKNMPMSWQKKLVKFAVRPGKVSVLRGGQLNRMKLLVEAFKKDHDSEYTVVICSYEVVRRSWQALRMIEWDLVALDESHMIKSPSTHRWKQIAKLRDLSKCRVGLTGTPIANTLFDVWTQLEWLGEGLSGFTSYKAFRSYYGRFVKTDGSRQFDVLTGYDNLPILQERLARLCFMVSLQEVMPELPKKTYDVLEVEMTSTQREYYVKLQKQLMIELEAELASNNIPKQLTATHVLTKLLRLSQITAGFVKWDMQINEEGEVLDEGAIEQILPNPKVEVALEAIKATGPKEKVIVWTDKVPLLKAVSKRLTEEGIKNVTFYGATSEKDRDEAVDSYNEDASVKVFVGNPAAGGAGLDLWGHNPDWDSTPKDHGCDTTKMLYLSQNWSMIHRSQSEGRGTRRGTRVPVQIFDLIVPGTIDEEIAVRVLSKQQNAMQLQDVRDIMRRVLETTPDGDYNGE